MSTIEEVRPQNLRSVLALLFLQVAFFLLERQDPRKFAVLFSFDRASVAAGQLWRLFSYQFSQAGQGLPFFPRPLALFFTLLLLSLLGSTIEEELGTWNFLALFAMSSLGTAAVAAWLNTGVLGSLFAPFTLLYVYASIRREQRIYVFLAVLSFAWLLVGVLRGAAANAATLGGVVAAYAWFAGVKLSGVWQRADAMPAHVIDGKAMHNATRFAAMKIVLASGSDADVDRLIDQCERDVVAGVNVCPPIDYKPEHHDGYCLRCEGFAECAARYLRTHRTQSPPAG
jgi:membrane associated rhomboid family serine protease